MANSELLVPEQASIVKTKHQFNAGWFVGVTCTIHQPQGAVTRSPGLRGTSYPGSPSNNCPQPQRGCGQSLARQPLARGTQSLWDCWRRKRDSISSCHRITFALANCAAIGHPQGMPQSLSAVYIHLVFSTKDAIRSCATNLRATRSTLISAASPNNSIARPSSSAAWKTTSICSRDSDAPSRRPNG